MFATDQYNHYHRLQNLADEVWEELGDDPKSDASQQEADIAYEYWEFAAGLRSED